MRIYLSTHSTTFVSEKVIEMEIGIYITANNIHVYLGRELCLGDSIGLFSTASEVSRHPTLHWTPFFQCTLAGSKRCSVNNLFIIALTLDIHVF